MATLEEVYQKVLADEGERAAFVEAANGGAVQAFLAERGCEATEQQVADFLKDVATREGELSEAELAGVAGGCNSDEAAVSACTFGLMCAYFGVMSAVSDNVEEATNGQLLCGNIIG